MANAVINSEVYMEIRLLINMISTKKMTWITRNVAVNLNISVLLKIEEKNIETIRWKKGYSLNLHWNDSLLKAVSDQSSHWTWYASSIEREKIWKLQCILIVSHASNIDKNDTRTLYDRWENKYNMQRNMQYGIWFWMSLAALQPGD